MRALWNLIGIGSVTQVDDSDELQTMQVTERAQGGLQDWITDKVRRVGSFGFASVPPLGSEALLLRRNGERSRSMVIGTSHRPSRPKNLQPGDSEIYDVRGAKLSFTANGLLIDCAGLAAVIQNFSTLTVNGDIHVTGDVISRSGGAAVSLNTLHDDYNSHVHSGVQTGTSMSGPTNMPA